MQYEYIWKKILNPNEEVKYEFSIGALFRFLMSLFLGLIIFVLLGSLSYLFFAWPLWPAAVFSAALFLLFNWYLKIANAYAFTNKRVIFYRGWLWTRLITADYDQITDVTVEEPFFERIIFDTGYLYVNTAGTDYQEISFLHISRPYEAKKALDGLRMSF